MKFLVALIATVAAQAADGEECPDGACEDGLCCGAAADDAEAAPTCSTEEADVFVCAAAGGDEEAVEEKATTLALGAAFATLAYTLA